MEPEIIVYHDVNQLKKDFKWWKLFSYPENLKLEMPILTKEEVSDYNQRLQPLAASCACYPGKVLMAGSVIAYAIAFVMDFNPFPTPVHFLNVCLLAIAGALLGKGIGLLINYMKIWHVINALDQKIATRRPKKQARYRKSHYAIG